MNKEKELQEENRKLKENLNQLNRELVQQLARIRKLEEEIERLKDENQKLRLELFGLKPSKKKEEKSSDEVPRQESKKLGPPVGHKGTSRKKPEKVDRTVVLKLDACPSKKNEEILFKDLKAKLDELVKAQEITPDEKDEYIERLGEKLGQKTVTLVRTTPVKLTPAIALEPFASNTELLTNKFQADKIQETPNMANIEHQRSIYRYTICVDLHRIGTEADEVGTRISPEGKKLNADDLDFKKYRDDILRKTKIDTTMRSTRVCGLLDVVRDLYRDIRGRREDLKPLFLIGGIYESCNPCIS